MKILIIIGLVVILSYAQSETEITKSHSQEYFESIPEEGESFF
jgi:hypothetical protein